MIRSAHSTILKVGLSNFPPPLLKWLSCYSGAQAEDCGMDLFLYQRPPAASLFPPACSYMLGGWWPVLRSHWEPPSGMFVFDSQGSLTAGAGPIWFKKKKNEQIFSSWNDCQTLLIWMGRLRAFQKMQLRSGRCISWQRFGVKRRSPPNLYARTLMEADCKRPFCNVL